MGVKKGDKVKIEYTGTFDDGTVFDSSEKHGQPLEFEAGAGKVIKGFDEALIGMKKGEEKDITLKPSEAYGDHNSQLVKKVPKNKLPPDKEIKAERIQPPTSIPDWDSTTQIFFTALSTGADLDNLSDGEVDVYVEIINFK